MSKKLELFTSSATSSLKVKKDQTNFKYLLEKKKVAYAEYDVASDEAKKEHLRALLKGHGNGQIVLPALVVDDHFKGDYDWATDLEEGGLLNAEIGATK